MTTISRYSVRRAFVTVAALVIGVYILLMTWSAIEARGPAARVKELMPVIGAQIVDRPMTALEANYPLEAGDPNEVAAPSRLGDLPRDTLIFLNFWATWCEPCVAELPSMIRLRREMAGRPFMMVAVSYDESWEDVERFFGRVMGGVPRELVLARDPSEDEQAMLRTSFGTHKLPETYVIFNGRVLSRFVNAREWTDPTIVEYFERLTELR